MKRNLVIGLILGILAIVCGQVMAQECGSYGTKVKALDPDVGIPLSNFAAVGTGQPGTAGQSSAWIAYWDIGATPGIYDDQDVPYLQFGSWTAGPNKIVRANNIRLTGWGPYPAGSYVNPGDSDMGQKVTPAPSPLPSAGLSGFHYSDVGGSTGYDFEDPVYLKLISPVALVQTSTNDIRVTSNLGFLPGSRVSNNDPDSAEPLTPFKIGPPLFGPAGGPVAATALGPVAQLAFFNTNGNVDPLLGLPIYDDGDLVYLDVNPLAVVSPNDIRLY